MYSDNSLLPRDAIRLAALGALSGGAKTYAEVAGEVRHFVSRIIGPSLDLMGTSIEMLRYEGLAAAEGEGDGALLSLTDAGRNELIELLRTALRAPFNDANKLAMALKLRFLHLLDDNDRRDQADMMIEAARSELARLADLGESCAGEDGHFAEWLDHDIAQATSWLAWLEDFRTRL